MTRRCSLAIVLWLAAGASLAGPTVRYLVEGKIVALPKPALGRPHYQDLAVGRNGICYALDEDYKGAFRVVRIDPATGAVTRSPIMKDWCVWTRLYRVDGQIALLVLNRKQLESRRTGLDRCEQRECRWDERSNQLLIGREVPDRVAFDEHLDPSRRKALQEAESQAGFAPFLLVLETATGPSDAEKIRFSWANVLESAGDIVAFNDKRDLFLGLGWSSLSFAVARKEKATWHAIPMDKALMKQLRDLSMHLGLGVSAAVGNGTAAICVEHGDDLTTIQCKVDSEVRLASTTDCGLARALGEYGGPR